MFGIDDIIGQGMKIVSQVIDRVFPDPEARDRAKLEMMKLQQEGAFKELDADLQMALEQAKTNQMEAQSGNWFASNWRPLIGYISGLGLFYQFFMYPMMTWIAGFSPTFRIPPPMPGDLILYLVFGMLGLGTQRSFDKFKGTTSK